jgi:hypothetical protein
MRGHCFQSLNAWALQVRMPSTWTDQGRGHPMAAQLEGCGVLASSAIRLSR